MSYANNPQSLHSYADLDAFLGARQIKNLEYATRAVRQVDGAVSVRHHDTDIVTVARDGTVTLDTAGWHSPTTRARLNAYAPWWLQVRQHTVPRAKVERDPYAAPMQPLSMGAYGAMFERVMNTSDHWGTMHHADRMLERLSRQWWGVTVAGVSQPVPFVDGMRAARADDGTVTVTYPPTILYPDGLVLTLKPYPDGLVLTVQMAVS